MTQKILEFSGNALMFGGATLATIAQEDLRLWFVVFAGLLIKLPISFYQCREARRKSEEARKQLCKTCITSGLIPVCCCVKENIRPYKCPLKGK